MMRATYLMRAASAASRTMNISAPLQCRSQARFLTAQAADLQASAPQEVLPPTEDWAGADRRMLVHRSLDDFHPVDEISLVGRLFNAPIREDIVHNVVHWQLAKRRAGTASTKNRSEVSGSGRKVRPQKGTGRSRQGAITSPVFRGGGRAHGPKPRDWSYPLPLNVRRNGLRSVLTSKLDHGQLWAISSAALSAPKTSHLIRAVDSLGWSSVYVVDNCTASHKGVEPTLWRASQNAQPILAMDVSGINVYDMLRHDMVVLTLPALEALTARFAAYDALL